MKNIDNLETTFGQSEAALAQLANFCQAVPGVVITGSVGRAAILGEDMLVYKPNGDRRDVDVVWPFVQKKRILTGDARALTVLPPALAQPQPLDEPFHDWLQIDRPTGRAHLMSPLDRSICVAVDIAVFETETAYIGGMPLPVFNPKTQLHVDRLLGRPGPYNKDALKNASALERLDTLVASIPSQLPDELYEPFHVYGELADKFLNSERAIAARFNFIPDGVRKIIRPATKPIMARLAAKSVNH